MKLKVSIALIVATFTTACSIANAPPKPPSPPAATVRPIAVNFTQPITNIHVWFDGAGITTPQDGTATSGRVGFPMFPAAGADPSNVHIRADGYQPYDCVTHVPDGSYDFFVGTMPGAAANGYGQGWFVGANGSTCPPALTPLHVDPSTIPLEQLAAIRGAMWPQGLGLSIGPRPGSDDNIIATDFFADYPPADQARILAWEKQQGYTHVVMGPIVDSDGYHGMYAAHDWRTEFDAFLDVMQTFWDNGQAPIVFIHPDGWTLEQTQALTPLFQSARAQRLMRIVVPTGWEPTRYDWSSCTWAGYVSWARQTWPNALVLIHTVADVDAPVGTDALCDDNGKPNGEGWARVVNAGLHGWLIQNGAYTTGPTANPTLAQNFAAQFDPGPAGAAAHGVAWHFATGASGWPTSSTWGPSSPIRLYNAECTSYTAFWQRPNSISEAARQAWGDLTIASHGDGYLDGGTAPVPVRR